MAGKPANGTTVFISKSGATGTALDVTAVTKAAPAVLTVTDTLTAQVGDVIHFPALSTGMSEIDGKTFIAGAVDDTGKTIDLLGSDTTASTDTFLAGTNKPMVSLAADFIELSCTLSAITINRGTTDTVSVGTYCDPSASLPGAAAEAGTLDLEGFVDITDEGYKELLKAEADHEVHAFKIAWPNNGYLLASGVVTQVSQGAPLNGGIPFTASMVLSSAPVHLF